MQQVPDILTADEIRAWDRFTIEENGSTSLELREQAAQALANHWERHQPTGNRLLIACGMAAMEAMDWPWVEYWQSADIKSAFGSVKYPINKATH